MIRECKHCGIEFNDSSWRKKKVGGYINECPDCVEELGTEKAVRYRGVTAGDGKMQAMSILKFESEADAEAYVRSFNQSSGSNARKMNRCNDIRFTHVGSNIGNSNHKGKK